MEGPSGTITLWKNSKASLVNSKVERSPTFRSKVVRFKPNCKILRVKSITMTMP